VCSADLNVPALQGPNGVPSLISCNNCSNFMLNTLTMRSFLSFGLCPGSKIASAISSHLGLYVNVTKNQEDRILDK
jgi:hypothetical protein